MIPNRVMTRSVRCFGCGALVSEAHSDKHRCKHHGGPAEGRFTRNENDLNCEHRGAELRSIGCGDCGPGKSVKVFSCSVHEECVVSKAGLGVKTCAGCRDIVSPKRYRYAPAALEPVHNMAVLTTYFNPTHDVRFLRNYNEFASKLGVPLLTAELAYDDDPFELPSPAIQIRVPRDRHLMWQKERLLNLLIASLPLDVDAVAWLDADVVFMNTKWYAQTLNLLSQYRVIQLFEDSLHYTPTGKLVPIRQSAANFFANDREFKDINTWHPGFAWAARLDTLHGLELEDRWVASANDVVMTRAFVTPDQPCSRMLRPRHAAWLDEWYKPMYERVAGACGVLPGTVLHLWHGEFHERRYGERWNAMAQSDFDPHTDIEVDDKGLYRWTDHAMSHKADLVIKVANLFN